MATPRKPRNKPGSVTVVEAKLPMYQGFLETVGDNFLTGWCCDISEPTRRVELEFVVDDFVIGQVHCDRMRDDLVANHIGDGSHGFMWAATGDARNLFWRAEARVAGTDIILPRMVAVPSEAPALLVGGSEEAAAPEADVVAPNQDVTMDGAIVIDGVWAAGVSGWIAEADGERTLNVNLYLDGRLMNTVQANLFRDDVAALGQWPGRHGFLVPVTDACFDGGEHVLELEVVELGERVTAVEGATGLRVLQHAAFQVEYGLVSGRVDVREVPEYKGTLAVYADGGLIGNVPVTQSGLGIVNFKVELPLDLADGLERQIRVILTDSPYCLGSTDGRIALAYRSTLKGKMDRLDENGVEGWAYDIEQPDSAITLEVYDGASLIARVDTNVIRNDVNKNFGIEGAHGFLYSFPAYLYDGLTHHISVRFNGQTLSRRSTQPFPISLTPAHLAAVPIGKRYVGCVDGATHSVVHGWVCDTLRPDDPVTVAIHVDGECIGYTRANRFEARLRNGWRSGHHVFTMRLPLRLMNGRKRHVSVVVLESQYELPNRHASVLFPLVDYFGSLPDRLPEQQFSYTPPARQWLADPAMLRPLEEVQEGDPLISIITLNWNGARVLREFLASFRRVNFKHTYEIILLDHGSSDDSLAVVAEFADLPLRLIERGANYSFSASNNFGARLAKGKYLVFANNDLVMLHDCLAPMLSHLVSADVGMVGLKLLEPLRLGAEQWGYVTHHQSVLFPGYGVLPGTNKRYYVPMEQGEQLTADLAAVYHVPVVTGALMMCRASDFDALGGFHEGYFYGMEDVDLCLGVTLGLGKKVISDTSAVALHNRSATRESKLQVSEREKMYNARIHAGNRSLYISRFARHLTRRILQSLVAGEDFWRATPLRVGFVVSEATMATFAGDFFTAVELAEAMRRVYGWETVFVPKRTYNLPGVDVLVVMLHDYQIEKVTEANPGLVTVAWARNRMDEWVSAPYFDAYQLIFCSSRKAVDYVKEQTGRDSVLLPIATNARRFRPLPPVSYHSSDVTFTGSYWLDKREAIDLQDLSTLPYQFAMYGHGWGEHEKWRHNWRGAVPYTHMPEIYSSAKIVLDDSHPVTREWNSLNSRVFDAIGCGRLVLTNCSGGAAELFPDLLPTFSTADELQQLLKRYLDAPEEREALAAKLHAEVLAHHTYDNRAMTFREELARFVNSSLRFAIKIGVPNAEEREAWGDYHFALGIKRALERKGHFARIDILPDWDGGLTAGDDVNIVLRGLSQYKPQPTAINLMWLISHPDDITLSECQSYDHVFVASVPYAERLAGRLGERVSPLLQCTDPELFYPDSDESLDINNVIFVGNSRGQRREVVQYALDSGLDFGVYGGMWDNMLPAGCLKAKHIPNQELRRYYSTAKVVLNDHWPDMRSEGFISNRIYDAGACGAALVTDDMTACRDLFGDAVSYYDSAESLHSTVEGLLDDADARTQRGAAFSELIRREHTFDHRVAEILARVSELNQPG